MLRIQTDLGKYFNSASENVKNTIDLGNVGHFTVFPNFIGT